MENEILDAEELLKVAEHCGFSTRTFVMWSMNTMIMNNNLQLELYKYQFDGTF